MDKLNISLLHHWLVSLRGGEKVLEQFCKIFPGSDVHSLVKTSNTDNLGTIIPNHSICTTLLDRIPNSEKYYKSLLPLFPKAIENHRVEADFILSSDASLVKGVKKEDHVPHVCYCHSPPRYLWDMQDEYISSMHPVKAKIFEWLTPYLRAFDKEGAGNVDHFIANSNYVRNRINRIYDREAEVIHPPVSLDDFEYAEQSEEFYFIVAALVPYKRIDIAVKAFNKLGKRLVIIGNGSEKEKLEEIAEPNVVIMGPQPFQVLKDHYKRCKAFIFPGVEDFGITPLEAQASGKPVIAMRKGGALETVVEGETGVFFVEQTPEALIEAVKRFENNVDEFSPKACRKNAEKFSPERFREEIKAFLIEKYPSYFSDFKWGVE